MIGLLCEGIPKEPMKEQRNNERSKEKIEEDKEDKLNQITIIHKKDSKKYEGQMCDVTLFRQERMLCAVTEAWNTTESRRSKRRHKRRSERRKWLSSRRPSR